jgi:hypothetical protein
MRLVTSISAALIGIVALHTVARAECQDIFVRANALFIHATVECNHNYMDTPGGYYALAMSRQCVGTISEFTVKAIIDAAFREFDALATRKGKRAACAWVYGVERAVEKDVARIR